jgi:hypothetical protein
MLRNKEQFAKDHMKLLGEIKTDIATEVGWKVDDTNNALRDAASSLNSRRRPLPRLLCSPVQVAGTIHCLSCKPLIVAATVQGKRHGLSRASRFRSGCPPALTRLRSRSLAGSSEGLFARMMAWAPNQPPYSLRDEPGRNEQRRHEQDPNETRKHHSAKYGCTD